MQPSGGARSWLGDPSGRTALLGTSQRSRGQLAVRAKAGFSHARTGAMAAGEAEPLLKAGWKIAAHLHLLRHDLKPVPPQRPRSGARLRRTTSSDLDVAVSLDDEAFPAEWRLGRSGLADALKATPQSRFRIARYSNGPAGYAICGRSRRDGYIQRLAVASSHRRESLGRALTLDGLRWLKRWRATSASVNTYVGNDAALRLYLSLGFVEVHPGLMVLTIEL